jgi:hypothetical protein
MIAEGIAALSLALVGVGAVALVAFAGIPGIIVGVGLAAAALIAIEWQAIKTIFDGISEAIRGFIDYMGAIYG